MKSLANIIWTGKSLSPRLKFSPLNSTLSASNTKYYQQRAHVLSQENEHVNITRAPASPLFAYKIFCQANSPFWGYWWGWYGKIFSGKITHMWKEQLVFLPPQWKRLLLVHSSRVQISTDFVCHNMLTWYHTLPHAHNTLQPVIYVSWSCFLRWGWLTRLIKVVRMLNRGGTWLIWISKRWLSSWLSSSGSFLTIYSPKLTFRTFSNSSLWASSFSEGDRNSKPLVKGFETHVIMANYSSFGSGGHFCLDDLFHFLNNRRVLV